MELSKSDCIQAAMLLHPSRVTVDDIKGTIITLDKLIVERPGAPKMLMSWNFILFFYF